MAKLDPKERDKMAEHNKFLFKEQIKENKKRGNIRSPISSSQKRAGYGKGDAPRPVNKRKWDTNYTKINWNSKK